jgi:nicotinate phosphoribosyltransferase
VAQRLREQGHSLIGVRLDSGDLAYLSVESRKILDEAGLQDVKIVASGDLDEYLIESLRQQGARIDMWGVGTRLVTAHDDPALGGVYKLTAVRKPDGPWEDRIKLSEQVVKTSLPGMLQVRRFHRDGQFLADMIYDERLGTAADRPIVHPADPRRRKRIPPGTPHVDLLEPVVRGGNLVCEVPSLEHARQRCREQLGSLHPGIKRLVNPHEYPAGLDHTLQERWTRLIMEARGEAP